ncbi:MAG: UDP-2,3-diacylglucosamine hydrolase [Alphaproteobacteria bacterium]|jgi:DUF1009 family protein|nr:UDP-2,3-diacylglucosamine hydrolase [Alphaproteobacteria bacterium]
MSEHRTDTPSGEGPLAIICGGGSLPFAVADAVLRRGRRVVLLGLRGFANPERILEYPHHWIAMGQYGRFLRVAAKEGCREVVFIGSVVRPALWHVRIDLQTLKIFPRLAASFRGGDNYLLSGLIGIIEQDGIRVIGAQEVAPDILVPQGVLGRYAPSDRDRDDIARGLALIAAIGAFDVGQAAVVADNHVLAMEAIEGTDQMLARIAELRRSGRLRAPAGTGVLIKAPKPAQDRRVDLPSIGPHTIEGVARAGLAGLAVVAGETVIAEPEQVAQAADRAKLFVVAVAAASADARP